MAAEVDQDGKSSIKEFLRYFCRQHMKQWSSFKCLSSLFPIISWLPNYSWRSELISDIVSGLTIGVLQIPQGMAYAMLAGVPPVAGIYTAVFPVLVYIMMGTMPQVSMGTFAVVSLLVAEPVNHFTTDNVLGGNFTKLEVATSVSFTCGILT